MTSEIILTTKNDTVTWHKMEQGGTNNSGECGVDQKRVSLLA